LVKVEGELVIGREDADLTIPDLDLSRRHAVVRQTAGGVEVEDLGSTNGTYLDGVRVTGTVRLSGPGKLRMGSSELELLGTPADGDGAGAGREGEVGAPELAGVPEDRGRRVRRIVDVGTMAIAAIATVAVVVVVATTSGSSDVKLASKSDIPPAPRLLRPFVATAGTGQAVTVRGTRYVILAPSAGTGGALTMLDVALRHGSEPPPQTDLRWNEAFYLLSGTMTFAAGNSTLLAGPGDLVFLPRGVGHRYQVTSGVAHVLMLGVPGGLDRFLTALSRNPAASSQISRQYGVQPAAAPAPPSAARPLPFVTHASAAPRVVLRGSPYTILAGTHNTGGALAFLEVALHHGSEPPAHIHHHEDEIFFVLGGNMLFSAAGKTVALHPGQLLFLPRGLQHAYVVTSPNGVAHILLLGVPSGLELLFKALSLIQNPNAHPGQVGRVSKRYGIQIGAAPVTLPPSLPPSPKPSGSHKSK
jgi:quercetin dioxygenase-like cupin family protein